MQIVILQAIYETLKYTAIYLPQQQPPATNTTQHRVDRYTGYIRYTGICLDTGIGDIDNLKYRYTDISVFCCLIPN